MGICDAPYIGCVHSGFEGTWAIYGICLRSSDKGLGIVHHPALPCYGDTTSSKLWRVLQWITDLRLILEGVLMLVCLAIASPI